MRPTETRFQFHSPHFMILGFHFQFWKFHYFLQNRIMLVRGMTGMGVDREEGFISSEAEVRELLIWNRIENVPTFGLASAIKHWGTWEMEMRINNGKCSLSIVTLLLLSLRSLLFPFPISDSRDTLVHSADSFLLLTFSFHYYPIRNAQLILNYRGTLLLLRFFPYFPLCIFCLYPNPFLFPPLLAQF